MKNEYKADRVININDKKEFSDACRRVIDKLMKDGLIEYMPEEITIPDHAKRRLQLTDKGLSIANKLFK